MTNLQKLINILSEPDHAIKLRIAGNSNTCIICKGNVTEFSNVTARFEYEVSRICESCQIKYIHKAYEHFVSM